MTPMQLFNTLERINNASNPVIADVLDASKQIYVQALYLDDAMHIKEIRKCLDSLGAILQQIVKRETRIDSSFDEPLIKLMNTLQKATQKQVRTEKRRVHFTVREYECEPNNRLPSPNHPCD